MIGWFGYLNYILMLCNFFIPALPFDAGRMLRAYLSSTSVVSTRESIAAPWTAHACAVLLGFIGLVRLATFQIRRVDADRAGYPRRMAGQK